MRRARSAGRGNRRTAALSLVDGGGQTAGEGEPAVDGAATLGGGEERSGALGVPPGDLFGDGRAGAAEWRGAGIVRVHEGVLSLVDQAERSLGAPASHGP